MRKKSIPAASVLLLAILLAFGACAETDTETAIQLGRQHIAQETGIPEYVLSGITTVRTIDCFTDWYVLWNYLEPPGQGDAQDGDRLILCAVYVRKSDGAVSDAQRHTGDALFKRIFDYRGGAFTRNQYLALLDSWEALFGPVRYWQYDLRASFQLLYHFTADRKIVFQDGEDYLISPEKVNAILPGDGAVTFGEALEKARDAAGEQYGIGSDEIRRWKYGSAYYINANSSSPFHFSGKYSDHYWIIWLYRNDSYYIVVMVLDDGTVEQMKDSKEIAALESGV